MTNTPKQPRKIIGEGTYGCVLKPSFHCKNKHKKIKYENKLSKVMLKKDAQEEYNEMKKITSYAGIEKYVVSMPEICDPKQDTEFLRSVSKCENKRLKTKPPSQYKMLIVEDGGVSLRHFEKEISHTLSKKDMCIFLTKIHHLLEGLLFFYRHGIIHHDIKARNIVYNIANGKIRFIDFGLMKSRDEMIETSRNNTNTMAQTWENFPPEYKCANLEDYDGSDKCTFEYDYETYLERLAITFDWYSFGIMMTALLDNIKIIFNQVLSPSCRMRLYDFFMHMGEPDIAKRTYDISDLPKQYEALLRHYRIWDEGSPSPSEKSIQLQTKYEHEYSMDIKSKTAILNVLGKKSTRSMKKGLKPCSDHHEYNHETRRCYKKCKPGYRRHEKTRRCRKP